MTRTLTVHGTLTEARAERHRHRASDRPTRPPPPGTLHDLAREFFRARAVTLARATVRNLDDDYRLRIAPSLGHLQLADLDRSRLEAWLAGLVAVSGRRMVWSTVKTLRTILKAGVEWGRTVENPAQGLRLPPKEQGRGEVERVLSPEQVQQLIERGAATLRIETLLRCAGEAGLRRGELIGLRWTDLDLPGRRIHVRRSVHEGREQATKGRRARRVAISAALAERLADWYSLAVVEGGAAAAGYVWPGRRGGPVSTKTPLQALWRACERAGLVDDEGHPMVSLHGLRHTAASIMLGAGVPLLVVSRQLGHADPNITAQVYAHLIADEQLDAAAAPFAGATRRPRARERAPERRERKP